MTKLNGFMGKAMANEELHQRGYLFEGKVRGMRFGEFEELNIGATTVRELSLVGVDVIVPSTVDFPFVFYKAPKKAEAAKPDRVFLRRQVNKLFPVATAEHKAPAKLRTERELITAAEQGLMPPQP